ncbi:MAG: S-ribosylhomocysteine lyase [Clostridia bacterium]|nr:S-ribosylhomocysteine lyase [Clostridia bacterium]
MDRIASFTIDHTVLMPGIYTSRIDGDVTTYDLRMRRPNVEPVISNASIHTIEHLFATYVRNSKFKDNIIYFGPMGCRTGCYFLVRDMAPADAVELVKQATAFIAGYEGEIPGVTAAECGNYREHSLPEAKKDAARYLNDIKDWTAEKLSY